MTAVRTSGPVRRFGSTRALDGIDLAVQEGEIRRLLGPNGAGKTTLLRILFGLIAANAGTVELLGRRLELSDPGSLNGVAGFVEDPSFYPYLSGRANLELLAELDGGAARARVLDALEQVGLSTRAEDRVSGYSSGMRQRLGIAASLLRAPRLLLLDEPTSGLDPAGARDVCGLMRKLGRQGVAVLVSSHQIDQVEEVCDSFTVLGRGSVVWDGTAAQLPAQAPVSRYRLESSDDLRACALAVRHPGVDAARAADRGLIVAVEPGRLDQFTLALGHDGVAIRRLELERSPLEEMFFALTAEEADPVMTP